MISYQELVRTFPNSSSTKRFHCRSWGSVIYTRGIGSKDMVVWHLMHIDKAINHTLEKFFPPA
ncbi:TPA: DUF7238 family protein [Escherichia coli]